MCSFFFEHAMFSTSAKLAVLTAPAVYAWRQGFGIMGRLAFDAGSHSGYGSAPAFGNRLAAFRTMRLALTHGNFRPGDLHGIRDCVVYLVLHGPITGPTGGHFPNPYRHPVYK